MPKSRLIDGWRHDGPALPAASARAVRALVRHACVNRRRGRTPSIHGPAVAAGAPAFTGAPREAGQAGERDGRLSFPGGGGDGDGDARLDSCRAGRGSPGACRRVPRA
jgi:hypothetical protein